MGGDAPAPEEAPQTLAAGELVWAKSKGRQHWWPARLRDACAKGAFRRDGPLVSCFGDAGADPRRATQVRGFGDQAADGMARATLARGFLAAVEEAQARAVAILQRDLACACASPPPGAAGAEMEEGSVGVANLAPSEFLAFLRDAAALHVSSVGLVDRARLKSWVRAVAEGWGPDGAGHYPRRSIDDLVDKIDLDVVPAGDDRDAADWAAGNEDKALERLQERPKENNVLERPQETPAQKRRSVTSLMGELHAGEEDDDQKNERGGPGTGLTVKRERKKSKYLSPPYTNLGGFVHVEKLADLPKELLPSAAKDDKKVLLLDNVGAREVLLLVRCFGKDVFNKSRFPKAAKGFLDLFRSSAFFQGAHHDSYKEHTCPAENAFAKAGADVAALVSDSCASLKQGKVALKSSRKKDQDGSGGSSIKRKKMEKTSLTVTLGCGVSITPAIPIRQVRAEDIRSEVNAGGGARGMGVGVHNQKNKLVFKSPISAAMSAATKPGRKRGQANDGSVLKTPANAGDASSDQSAKKNDEGKVEATKSETDIQVDMNVQSVIVDVPVRSVQMEATKSETAVQVDMNMQSVIVDVPVRSVQMEAVELEPNLPVDTNEQTVVGDVPVKSGSLPTHGDMSQPADGNKKDDASVEVRTVQESYASLEAMVPEMLKKVVEASTGRNVIAMSHALKDEDQKGEQPNQTKTADEAIANHSPGKATNGTCPDPANSTHKKKKKKKAQSFPTPAEILLDFTNGVVLPSKEELLSVFCKFGFLIESETDILKDTRSARVVFGKSADAEAVYHKRDSLGMFGQFGPPFATLRRLNYLPNITLSIPPPASKPSLADIRKNLENMISSLAGHSPLKMATSSAVPKPVSGNLLGQMQGLLSEVDKMLAGPSRSTSTPP